MTTKLRADAWEAQLAEETRRELYRLTKPPTVEEAADGRPFLRDFERDVRPYLSLRGITEPSRAGWYRFLGRMREEEAAETVISVETSKRIAQGIQATEIDFRLAADMMTSLSVDEAVKGNGEAAKILGYTAAKYAKAALGEEKLKLDAAKQRTADEQLRLAREKFEEEAARRTAAEARAEKAEAEAEALKATIKELEKALQDAGKVNVADPARVAAEVDRILGRKPQQ